MRCVSPVSVLGSVAIIAGLGSWATSHAASSRVKLPAQLPLPNSGRLVLPQQGPLTIEPRLQAHLQRFLRRKRSPIAAAVAVDVRTGAIVAFAQGRPPHRWGFHSHTALYSGFPAASLFKSVVTAAALELDLIDPQEKVGLTGGCRSVRASGSWLRDKVPGRRFQMSLRRAFGRSCNGFYAKLAVNYLGLRVINRYARKFGWFESVATDFAIPPSPINPPDVASASAHAVGRYAAGFGDVGMSAVHAAWTMAMLANEGREVPLFLFQRNLAKHALTAAASQAAAGGEGPGAPVEAVAVEPIVPPRHAGAEGRSDVGVEPGQVAVSDVPAAAGSGAASSIGVTAGQGATERVAAGRGTASSGSPAAREGASGARVAGTSAGQDATASGSPAASRAGRAGASGERVAGTSAGRGATSNPRDTAAVTAATGDLPRLRAETARDLRALMDATVRGGTASSAFGGWRMRRIRGEVGGKTGTLHNDKPKGVTTWFAGLYPLDKPRLAVATVVVLEDVWYTRAANLAAEAIWKYAELEAAAELAQDGNAPHRARPGADAGPTAAAR